MTKVFDHYQWVRQTYGQEIASKFYKLANKWDNYASDTMNAFYTNDLLMQLTKEARE